MARMLTLSITLFSTAILGCAPGILPLRPSDETNREKWAETREPSQSRNSRNPSKLNESQADDKPKKSNANFTEIRGHSSEVDRDEPLVLVAEDPTDVRVPGGGYRTDFVPVKAEQSPEPTPRRLFPLENEPRESYGPRGALPMRNRNVGNSSEEIPDALVYPPTAQATPPNVIRSQPGMMTSNPGGKIVPNGSSQPMPHGTNGMHSNGNQGVHPGIGTHPGTGNPQGQPIVNQPRGTTNPQGTPLPPGTIVLPGTPGMAGFPGRTNELPNPTAVGELLQLGPNETGLDKALELAQKVAVTEAENRQWLEKVKLLSAELEAREKTLVENTREIDLAVEDVAQTRKEMQDLRKQIGELKQKIRQLEKDDVETLKSMIGAIERLLESTKPKNPGKSE